MCIYKEFIMKRTLKSFFVSALLVLICFSFVACANDLDNISTDSSFGGRCPEKVSTKYKINSTMTALQMYEAGVKNFNDANYVAAKQLGNITTKSLLGTMNQKLDSTKIKQNDRNYLDSYTFTVSGSPKIKICDQSIYENGRYRVRSADQKKISVVGETVTVAQWPTPETFNSLREGLNKYPNDPTRINMYIINKDTVTSSTKPIFDAKNKTYSFDLVLDTTTATVDYLKNMSYNTNKGGISTKPGDIKFTRLKIKVVMWDNGLIKTIGSDEAYEVKALGTTNKTTLLATTYFSYDTSELDADSYFKRF